MKRNGLGLCNSLKATEEARLFVEDAIVEKQPLPSAVRLLANEEFDKETGGYQSEIDEDEDEAEEPVQNAQGGDVVSKKRKASSKIDSSKYVSGNLLYSLYFTILSFESLLCVSLLGFSTFRSLTLLAEVYTGN